MITDHQMTSQPQPDPDSYSDGSDSAQLFVPECLFRAPLDSYTCGVRWSPQGETCAVATETRVHVFSQFDGERSARSSVKQAECLYSWDWARLGDRDHLVTTGRYQPVQLYRHQGDSLQLEATYKCINQLDELSHAYSVTTDDPVTSVYCGLVGEVRVFDVSRPGRESWSHRLVSSKGERGQGGIISCLATSPALPVFAAGSYDRTVGLYSKDGERLCVLRGHQGGVTQLTFTKDGGTLITGGRKDNEIIAWDLRQPGQVLYTMSRVVDTNQTVAFTLSPCEKFLCSANTDGSVRVWPLGGSGELHPVAGWLLHNDAVTGVSWHPGGDRLATATGQRHPDSVLGEEEEESTENVLVIWRMCK